MAGLALATAGHCAEQSMESPTVTTRAWRAILEIDHERLMVETVEVTSDRDSIVVGSISGTDSSAMAFLVPASADAIVSSTWVTTSCSDGAPLTVWSAGACRMVLARSSKTTTDLAERAPWLEWGTTDTDLALLVAACDAGVAAWASNELLESLQTFWPDQDLGAAATDITRETLEGTEMPTAVAGHWKAITARWTDTRTFLQRIDSLCPG